MPSGKKRKRHKMATHKRKKRLRKNRHKKKKAIMSDEPGNLKQLFSKRHFRFLTFATEWRKI